MSKLKDYYIIKIIKEVYYIPGCKNKQEALYETGVKGNPSEITVLKSKIKLIK